MHTYLTIIKIRIITTRLVIGIIINKYVFVDFSDNAGSPPRLNPFIIVFVVVNVVDAVEVNVVDGVVVNVVDGVEVNVVDGVEVNVVDDVVVDVVDDVVVDGVEVNVEDEVSVVDEEDNDVMVGTQTRSYGE